MSAQQAQSLPECPGCDRPVRRDAYAANGGLCTDCITTIEEINRGLAARSLMPLFPADTTP